MGSVIKGYRYRLVDNRSFEIPLPIKYELLKEDDPIAFYEISSDERVSFKILTKYKENMITPINRPLDISDIYYFLSSRVFQNGTPFTAAELQLIGLERYNVYDIIRKTRGVTPYDTYWLRFDGDKCDYDTARSTWEELTSHVHPVEQQESKPKRDPFTVPGAIPFVATSTKTLNSEEESHVSDILNQHKMNFSDHLAKEKEELFSAAEEIKSSAVANNTMSMDEIDALLLKSGLGGDFDEPAPKHKEHVPVEQPKSSGGMMSQEDIEKMLAAASAPQAAAEPTPVEEPKPNGGKMSQEDIEKMLAAASAPQAAAEPTPVEEPKTSGGKMSQEDIEKMLAAASAPEAAAEPTPVQEPKPGGGKMSQEDIEKMLAAASAPEAAAEPIPVEEPKSSGGKMSQEDIEKMLAAASAPEAAAEPTPVEEPKQGGGKMSQEDIEKMLAAASAPQAAAEPIPIEEPKPSGGKMSQEDIEKMLAAASAPEAAAEPTPVEEPKASGGKMSQADIEALLNGMKEDAGQ